ncbi:hypothetical protein CROQUDRAFT_47035 [Cronartium quercuum f. sp. fusiforme G11]|uniref:DUF7872 domain-containing protein n=1 Tax=Cronartium quercuum f. sp. fusiforme G11 TaxID=708437 RepID=A0A9P6NIC7_9BASI|nr:hypothetical protein CROQUDRAFT_47035 [Cronartium quercuum f. sp. fusiforme G11]
MICTKRVALIVFTALICATKSSPASKLAAEFHHSRLVARSHDNSSSSVKHELPAKLTPEHWREMNLDDYLLNYPNGNSLSLPMYVEHLHLRNKFECGVHKHCSIGPVGDQVTEKDYYVLFATAQWNYYTNSLSRAIRAASILIKRRVPGLIHDFVKIPPGKDDAHVISEPDLIRIILGGIAEGGTVNKSGVGNSTHPDYLAALEPLSTDLAQKIIADAAEGASTSGAQKPPSPPSPLATSTGATQSFSLPSSPNQPVQKDHQSTKQQAEELANQIENSDDQQTSFDIEGAGINVIQVHSDEGEDNLQPTRRMKKRQLEESDVPVLPIVYNSTATIESNIETLSVQFQALVDDSFTHKINAPISQKAGLLGALEGGRFLVEHVQPASLRPRAEEFVDLITISALLQSQTDCHVSDDLAEPDTLRFCSSDGTLAEIVLVKGNSLVKKIYHSQLIETKYGFSTAFLVAEAWRCQQSTDGNPEEPKFKNDKFEVCDFDLSVCNLKEPRLARLLDEGSSILKICRQEVGLQI